MNFVTLIRLFSFKVNYDLPTTRAEQAYTYYTMAIYQNSHGMTDMRKPEFKLTVTSIEINSTDPQVIQLINASQLPKEEVDLTIHAVEERDSDEYEASS